MQMEAPKQPQQGLMPQQGPPGPNGTSGKRMMPPPQNIPNMPSQQIRVPPPPYMHQPVNMI
jgi:hypothetical protein